MHAQKTWTVGAWEVLKVVLLIPLVVPLLLVMLIWQTIAFLIPKRIVKLFIWLVILLAFYRYVFPRRDFVSELTPAFEAIPRRWSEVAPLISIVWLWLHDQNNIALVGSIGSAIAFLITFARQRSLARKQIREKLDLRNPELLINFSFVDGAGWVGSIVNAGAGIAICIRFRLYMISNASQGKIVRVEESSLLPRDTKRIWLLRQMHEFPCLLPDGKQSETVSIAYDSLEETTEIMLEVEFLDTLDRVHKQTSHGSYALLSGVRLGSWAKSVRKRGERVSKIPAVIAVLGFYISRVIWRFDNVTLPEIEYQKIKFLKRVHAWKEFREGKSKQTDKPDR